MCWYCEKKGHRASECRKKQKDNDSGKSKGSKTGDSKCKSNKKELGRFSKDRWLITHPVPCKGTQHRWIVGKLVNDVIMSGVQILVVKSDQQVSIVDVKNSLMREFHGVEGLTVLPEESLARVQPML